MDDLKRLGEDIHAGDTYICCHKIGIIGHLAVQDRDRWLEVSIFHFWFSTIQR